MKVALIEPNKIDAASLNHAAKKKKVAIIIWNWPSFLKTLDMNISEGRQGNEKKYENILF